MKPHELDVLMLSILDQIRAAPLEEQAWNLSTLRASMEEWTKQAQCALAYRLRSQELWTCDLIAERMQLNRETVVKYITSHADRTGQPRMKDLRSLRGGGSVNGLTVEAAVKRSHQRKA